MLNTRKAWTGVICRLYKKSISLSASRIVKVFDGDKKKLRVKVMDKIRNVLLKRKAG